MLIGVISDTHDNIFLVEKILENLLHHGVDLIIHLGDIISPFVVKKMKDTLGNKDVIAVKGNNDGDVYLLSTLFQRFGWVFSNEPFIYEIEGRKLFLFHGFGNASFTEELAEALAKSLRVDAVLFGHTHNALIKIVDGKIVLNPGEGCGYLTGHASYGVIDISSMESKIYYL
ncbi:MAG: metallophosphoesterase [Thermosphaera sp.]